MAGKRVTDLIAPDRFDAVLFDLDGVLTSTARILSFATTRSGSRRDPPYIFRQTQRHGGEDRGRVSELASAPSDRPHHVDDGDPANDVGVLRERRIAP
jgi:beta-phosphoglucomutase-like phosphatase (HAD superfamily)